MAILGMMSAKKFERKHKAGELPYVVELQPSIPNHKLYRADLIDRYAAGEWEAPRTLASHRRIVSRPIPRRPRVIVETAHE